MAFSDYAATPSSEKEILVQIWPSFRQMGWVLNSGSVYKITGFNFEEIVSVVESGTAYTSVAVNPAAGQFLHRKSAQELYLRTTDSTDPNGKFIVITVKQFFSKAGINAPHDLTDTGTPVHWKALVRGTSEFGLSLDNQNQLGIAIEGAGSVEFINDKTYWASRFDKWTWENKFCFIYAWNRDLPISEAKILYKGKIKAKNYSLKSVKFDLKDLINEIRANIALDDISDLSGALVSDQLGEAKQRLVYGRVAGVIPTPIDQMLDGYLLSGSVAITSGTATITGTSTSFLTHFSPGDQIVIEDVEEPLTIQTVTSNTSMTATETFNETSISGKDYSVLSDPKNKRFVNRVFQVSGHALKEPTTTITAVISGIRLQLNSSGDFFNAIEVGDFIEVNSQTSKISNIVGSNIIVLETNLDPLPAISDTVTVASIKNVYIDDQLLVDGRDFTIDAANGVLTLDPLAEFNVASVKTLTGTVTFNATTSVTGSGTLFTTELKPHDWVKASGQATYYEVLSIASNTALTLRSAAAYSATSGANFKSPKYYIEDESTVSCDCFGKTENGLKTGTFIKTGPAVVEDLLKLAGLTSSINTSDFTAAKSASKQTVGLVVPASYTDKATPKYRDVINQINQSIFGTLKQDEDFLLSYEVLEPGKETALSVNESDVLSFKIDSKSDKLIKTVVIEYDNREFDPTILDASFKQSIHTSEIGQYLVETDEEFRQNTVLVKEVEATTIAQRYGFYKELSSSVVSFKTKLQAIENEINEKVSFTHPLIYERFGSSDKMVLSAIQEIKKTEGGVSVEIEDLGNAFSRAAAIAEDDSADFTSADSSEKLVNGYITDDFGMMSNVGITSGINLIS